MIYASKAFTNVFSDTLQREVKPYGIVIQALDPTQTETDFHKTEVFQKIDKTDNPVKSTSPEAVVDISYKQFGKKLIVIPGMDNRLMVLLIEPIARLITNKKGIL